ncbi:MAG: DNA methyltransferase, partial [Kiritimatiellae bacterium]|nr:DNA methyltransferase [Kiritimatiellia bacterium]
MTETIIDNRLAEYVAEIAAQWQTGAATEHSYRPALQRLLADAIPRATIVNEPARIECGAPDILVRENGFARRPIGYVEAKDIGDGDLDGNGPHKEQFDRYKAELSNIVFTDYLDFHFYEDGQFVAKCRVAEVEGSRIVPAAPEELERFAGLLRHFAEVAPKRISSPARLAHLMAGKARLLARAVAATLRADTGLESAIGAQMQAFRQWLVHDIDAESFADVYAQTIVYGMFAARFHDTTPEDFSRAEAATLIPRSNPLLRRLFRDLDEYVDESIVWIIDDLVALFAASDVTAILKDYGKSTAQTDPLLHFYEDFLAAYNPTLRKQRGVWYTPAPVVRFIVRSVDAILRRDFNLPAGLADASKTRVKVVNDNKVRKSDAKFLEREMHRVQILDPAAGTGTFLAETVRHIRAKFAGQEGMWPAYVRDHLVPRLNGFEILMASYAMAHLKLDMLLSEGALTGLGGTSGNPGNLVNPVENARLRIFLTNSLEEFSEATGTLWAMELSNESREADFIKRDCPVMVVMGNPPYSVSSSNKGEWIQKLVADYKKGLGEKKINLDDDYIKFIRLGQHYIDKNGEGILAYISNNSFLDGITHRQMRKSLMESFDEIYILDLHGNARKKETALDGSKDENVFDIMQGVSINIFVKRERGNDLTQRRREAEGAEDFLAAKNAKIAKVFHAEVFGEREAKYEFLDAHDLANVDYKELHPQAPHYFFVPKDFALQEEYEKGFSVAELMPVNNSGIQTKRDRVVYQFTQKDIETVVGSFRNEDVESLRKRYSLPADGRDWTVVWAKDDTLKGNGAVTQILYHPFDKRWTFFSGQSSGFMAYPRMPQSSHLLHDNIALLLVRNTRRENPYNFFVTDTIVDKDGISGFDNCRFFPLYLYTENMGKVE